MHARRKLPIIGPLKPQHLFTIAKKQGMAIADLWIDNSKKPMAIVTEMTGFDGCPAIVVNVLNQLLCMALHRQTYQQPASDQAAHSAGHVVKDCLDILIFLQALKEFFNLILRYCIKAFVLHGNALKT